MHIDGVGIGGGHMLPIKGGGGGTPIIGGAVMLEIGKGGG